jgi:non-ribosomal peptide synthetase component F
LEMHLRQQPEKVSGVIVYSTDLFDASRIERMTGHFLNLLGEVAADAGKRLDELSMLSEGERHQLLMEWKDAAVDYPDKCVHQLFEEQVERTPDAVAVVFEGEQLTYRELNERANQVARFLTTRGVKKGVPMGILMDRSLEMVIAIWGLLKTGGAYVPLDTALPESRLEYIAKDTAMPFILTSRALVSRSPRQIESIIWEDAQPLFERESTDALLARIDPEDLAYIVYTSGSTGQAKGVLIPQRVFARCHFWATEVFRFTQEDN